MSVFLDFIIDDLGLGRSAATLIAYGLLFGTMQGMSGAITRPVYPHYFGRTHQGAIKGVVTTIGVAGTAAGPLLLALGFGASGSYRPVLTVAALVPAAIALFAFSVRLVTPGGVR